MSGFFPKFATELPNCNGVCSCLGHVFFNMIESMCEMKCRVMLGFVILLQGWANPVMADNWMARLADELLVAEVSIPGAHDAATGSGWRGLYGLIGDSFARTQDLNMQELWDVGVRAFDLRPAIYKKHINLNHGMVPTKLHLEDILGQMCGWLKENPSEFIIIHLLHASDGDKVEGVYDQRLVEVLKRKEYKGFLAVFRPDLRVGELRGKILILSRNRVSGLSVGGVTHGWSGSANWQQQTGGWIVGADGTRSKLFVQDFSSTYHKGALDTKCRAVRRMLEFSTTYKATEAGDVVWVFNFASAYSKVTKLFGHDISRSNGYRDNASRTHLVVLDVLRQRRGGSTGIIMMDYAGVDRSGGYEVEGQKLVRAIIEHNFL